jgi:hypothetical protein
VTVKVSGVTLAQAQAPSFLTAFIAALAASVGLPSSAMAVTGVTTATRRRRLLQSGVNVALTVTTAGTVDSKALTTLLTSSATTSAVQTLLSPTYAGITVATPTVANQSPTEASTSAGAACFAATERVTLESGVSKAMADVKVGDRVLTVNSKGQAVYSDVVYLPHGPNQQAATFTVVGTESGRDLKMTANHVLPAGACALPSLPLVAARQIAVGDCVQTVTGREQVVSVNKVEGQGIYTIIAMEELIVVNGIVATPFGGVNPTLANAYYNLHRLAYRACGAPFKSVNAWMQGAMEGVWGTLASFSF